MSVEAVFACKRCGQCCSGRGGIVLSPSDIQRIANFLQLSTADFLSSYTELVNNKHRLLINEAGNCIFFQINSGCIIHQYKPAICLAWPFFKGNICDPISFAMAKNSCHGIKEDISHAEFAKAGMQYLQENDLINKDQVANSLLYD